MPIGSAVFNLCDFGCATYSNKCGCFDDSIRYNVAILTTRLSLVFCKTAYSMNPFMLTVRLYGCLHLRKNFFTLHQEIMDLHLH